MASTIDSVALRERLNGSSGVKLLDVRNGAEFETAHIPGSYHLPLDQVGTYAGQLASVDDELVLVCQSGGRAQQAAEKLAGAGVTNTSVLQGGVGAWVAAGGPVDKGAEKWALERQVRLVAGSLVVTGILASTKAPKLKWLSGAVGGGLTFAALSNSCMMGNLLSKLPYNQAGSSDPDAVVTALLKGTPA